MPDHVVGIIAAALNDDCRSIKGSRILILGVAYKPDVADLRESPALDIIHLLQERGGEVAYHDPHVLTLAHEGIELASAELSGRALHEADCVVVVTHHSAFDWEWIADEARLIVDTRHVIRRPGKARVVYL
jgi:UDP-N-acetyl-D-glucosamine dehydrogenase